MNREQAEKIELILKEIRLLEKLPDKIRFAHIEGARDVVANIALELADEAKKVWADKLNNFKI